MCAGPTPCLGRWCWLVVLVLLAVLAQPAVVHAEVMTFDNAEDAYHYAVQLFSTDGVDASRAALEQLLAVAPSHAASVVALGTIYGMQVRNGGGSSHAMSVRVVITLLWSCSALAGQPSCATRFV